MKFYMVGLFGFEISNGSNTLLELGTGRCLESADDIWADSFKFKDGLDAFFNLKIVSLYRSRLA